MYFNGDDEKISCGYSHRTEKDEKEARERQLAEEKKRCDLARSREIAWEDRLKAAKCFHFVAKMNDYTQRVAGAVIFYPDPDKNWGGWHKTNTSTITCSPNCKILKMEKCYPDIYISYELA